MNSHYTVCTRIQQEILPDGPARKEVKEEANVKVKEEARKSDSSDEESDKKKKKEEKKKIFSFFEWMNAILALIAKNKYHRSIWVNG